jgi:4-hydroxythreonine-4-phosphate dehydrogenase
MEKLKIGITEGCTDRTGYNLILTAFEEPVSLELCHPIIYGNKETAIQQRRVLNLSTNFITISNTHEVQDGRLSLLQCEEGEKKAMEDCMAKNIDALVITPTGAPIPCPTGTTEILINEDIHMALVTKVDNDTIEAFRQTLTRDFDFQHPRIAILSDEPAQENSAEDTFEEKHMHVYGPYSIKEFFEEEKYMFFDGIITSEKEKATEAFGALAYEYGIRFYAGSDLIITSPFHTNTTSMNHATYIATDVYRNREAYDQERENPLPKLFHDKREDRNANNVE